MADSTGVEAMVDLGHVQIPIPIRWQAFSKGIGAVRPQRIVGKGIKAPDRVAPERNRIGATPAHRPRRRPRHGRRSGRGRRRWAYLPLCDSRNGEIRLLFLTQRAPLV